MKTRQLIAVVLSCVYSITSPSLAITGGEIIEKVQQRLDGYKTFTADFEKQFYWAALDKSLSREGAIYLRSPGHFRIDLDNGDAVVANGRAIWSYVERNKQVVISPYEGELRTPWQVFISYAERFVPLAVEETKLGGRSCYMLVLQPQNEASTTRQMKIWVDRKKWWLLKVETLETNEDITTYVLKEHRANKKIDDSIFSFKIPQGSNIVDRRNSAEGDE